jgi:hypothetical protein
MAPRFSLVRSWDVQVKKHMGWHRKCDWSKLERHVIGEFVNNVIGRKEVDDDTNYRVCATVARMTKGMRRKPKKVIFTGPSRRSLRIRDSGGRDSDGSRRDVVAATPSASATDVSAKMVEERCRRSLRLTPTTRVNLQVIIDLERGNEPVLNVTPICESEGAGVEIRSSTFFNGIDIPLKITAFLGSS